MKRKIVSKSKRFEVFNRDKFRCQYCNRGIDELEDDNHLEVDHIFPVSQGGDNSDTNLITSCRYCNSGKSDKVGFITSENIEKKYKKAKLRVEVVREKAEQLKKYYDFIKESEGFNAEEAVINEILEESFGFTLFRKGMDSILKLYNRVGMKSFVEAVEIVRTKKPDITSEEKFSYLCGVLHNMVRQREDPDYNRLYDLKKYYLYHPQKKGSDYFVDWKFLNAIKGVSSDKVKELIDTTFDEATKDSFEWTGGYFSTLLVLLEETKVP